MLPRVFSENLISLLPGVYRNAFTVFFYMDENGNVSENYEFCKSKIMNCCQLSYEVAQSIIEANNDTD